MAGWIKRERETQIYAAYKGLASASRAHIGSGTSNEKRYSIQVEAKGEQR